MKLILEAVVAELDGNGCFKSRVFGFSGLVMRLTGTEIDGVQFRLNDKGPFIELVMESGKGVRLSDEISTNYPAPASSPVRQIAFKFPEARFTANVLNKLLRRANKDFPTKALLIRDVKGLRYD